MKFQNLEFSQQYLRNPSTSNYEFSSRASRNPSGFAGNIRHLPEVDLFWRNFQKMSIEIWEHAQKLDGPWRNMREIPVWENYIPVYRDDKYQYPHTQVHVRCTCCGRRRSVGRDYADNCRVQLQNVFNEHAKKCDQMKFSEILSHLSNWKIASEILRNESRQRCIRYALSSELPGSESRSCGEEWISENVFGSWKIYSSMIKVNVQLKF